MFLIVVLYALFAASFPLIKKTLQYGSFIDLVWVRTGAVVFAFLPFLLQQRKELKTFVKTYPHLLLFYSFICGISHLCANWAIAHISVTQTALYYAFAPFVTAVVAHFFFAEKLTKTKCFGIGISILGMAAIVAEKIFHGGNLHSSYMADIILLVGVSCYAISWLIIKQPIREGGYASTTINGVASALIFLTTTPLILLQHSNNIPFPQAFWLWGIMQGTVASVICYTLYLYLLRFYSATFLSLAGLMEPVVAAFYAWMLYNEVPTLGLYLACAFIAFGLYVFHSEELRRRRQTKGTAAS